MPSLLGSFITSKMRIRILMRLFLNPDQDAYLRELSNEFNASTSQVKDELQHLSAAGLLESHKNGRQINYRANTSHPLFPELQSMVKKSLGMDQILESIIQRLGNLKLAFLVDDYAQGKDTGLIDLVLVGDIDRNSLEDLVKKTEKYINRKIRTFVLNQSEYKGMETVFEGKPKLILWESQPTKSA